MDERDIIGNKNKVRKKARSNKEIDVFQGKIADFSRYLGFSQAIKLFPIMSKDWGTSLSSRKMPVRVHKMWKPSPVVGQVKQFFKGFVTKRKTNQE